MDDRDVQLVVGQGRGRGKGVVRSRAGVNAARREGAIVDVKRKTVSSNVAAGSSADHQHIAKLDRENEVAAPQKVSMDVGRAMQNARAARDPPMTQAKLASMINESVKVIQDYESGKAIPNQGILQKLERALGVILRGQHIGEPLPSRKEVKDKGSANGQGGKEGGSKVAERSKAVKADKPRRAN